MANKKSDQVRLLENPVAIHKSRQKTPDIGRDRGARTHPKVQPVPSLSHTKAQAFPPLTHTKAQAVPPLTHTKAQAVPPLTHNKVQPVPPLTHNKPQPVPPLTHTKVQPVPPLTHNKPQPVPPLALTKAQTRPPASVASKTDPAKPVTTVVISSSSGVHVKQPTPKNDKRTGRYLAVGGILTMILITFYHTYLRQVPMLAGLVLPAIIMFLYLLWIVYFTKKRKRQMEIELV